MNNKLKQAFVGKPLTQKQIANWERARVKGRAKFVAWFTLWFGTMAFVGNSLGLHYLNGYPLRAKYLLAPALIWYTYAFLLRILLWSVMEKKYRESLNANETR